MHAKPGDGVNCLGMSLLTTNQAFDLKGKPVKIVLVLAATDSKSHLAAYRRSCLCLWIIRHTRLS